jgi:hypothetical protein
MQKKIAQVCLCQEQKLHLFVLLGVLNSISKTIGDAINPFAKLLVVFDINKLTWQTHTCS